MNLLAKIIVTIGPKSIDLATLNSLRLAGASSFRINLSHSTDKSLADYFEKISHSGVKPSIDTQGAQLRVEYLPDGAEFNKGSAVELVFGVDNSEVPGDGKYRRIVFNHPEVVSQVSEGDILKIDFQGLIVSLVRKSSEFAWVGEVLASGNVVKNRAVDVSGKAIVLSPLTKFDKYAIDFAQSRGCREVYASFVSSRDHVLQIRNQLAAETRLISKIESALGVANASEIIDASDAVLIDRGDLSREISIPSVPIAVQSILRIGLQKSKPVYIATNVLDSMMSSPLPSRAEISDIYTLLQSGVSGLVLAAEVAIGSHPVESTALVDYLIRLYQCHDQGLFGVGAVPKPSRDLVGDQLYNWI